MSAHEETPQSSVLGETLRRITSMCSDAAFRDAIRKEIRRLACTEEGRNSILGIAACLQGLTSELKAAASPRVKRGRPKDHALEKDRVWQALEYYDLRIKGVPRKKAIKLVHDEREDAMFGHRKRRPRSVPTFLRDMRARWNKVSKLLDLVTATPEQIADLRRELDNKSKPTGARTRK
jgi:hypothetical protein